MTTEPSTPARPNTEDEGVIDFAGLRDDIGFALHAPLRHPRVAGACVAFVLVVAALSSLVIPDVYQVQATILAQRNPVMGILSNPNLARGNDWDAPTRAARETVTRRDNLIALCKQTGFVEKYLASRSVLGRLRAAVNERLSGRKEAPGDILEGLADSLQSKLWVNVGPEGQVEIVFEWPNKEIAFQIVEAAVQNFLEARHATEISVLGETISVLEGSAATLQRELDSALTEAERKERARPPPAQRRIVTRTAPPVRLDEETGRLEGTLNARRRALADLEEFRARRLAELNTLLAQRQAIYAEQHPDVVSAKQSIASLLQPSPQAEALRGEIKDLEQALAKRASAAGTDAGGGGAFTTELLEPRFGAAPEDVRLDYDLSHMRFQRDQYANVLQRLNAARLELETAQAAFKYRYSVITPPMPPKGPKRPYTLLRVVGGVLGGIALALFATTAIDLRSGRILEEWQIRRQLDLPILARFQR